MEHPVNNVYDYILFQKAYVPEDDNKDNAYVEFNLSDYDKKDSELIYYSSVEEAILNSPLKSRT